MCRNDNDVVFYRVLYVTLFAIALTFTVILTSVFVDIDGLLALRNKDAVNSATTQRREFYHHDQSESDSHSDIDSNDYFKDGPPDYDDTSDSQPSRFKRSTDGQKYRLKNPHVTKILTSHLASLLEQFDPETNENGKSNTAVTTTDRPKQKDNSQYDRLKEELVKQTKEMEEENTILEHKEILKKNLKSLFLDAVAADTHTSFDEVAKKIKANLEAYESLNNIYSMHPTSPVLMERARSGNGKIIEEGCDILIDQMMQCLRGRGPRAKTVSEKEPKLLIKTTIDISSVTGKPVENLTYGKDEVMGVVKLVLNGKEILVDSQLDDVLELMRKHGLNVDSDNNVISLSQNIPIESKNEDTDFERVNVDESRRSLEELMRAYLRLASSKHEKSDIPINAVENHRLRRHKRYAENLKGETSGGNLFNIDEEEEIKSIKKRIVLKALVNKIESFLQTDDEEKQKVTKKKAMVLKHWHIKKRMQSPLKSDNNRGSFNKTRKIDPNYAVATSTPKTANSAIEHDEKIYISQKIQKENDLESAETGDVDIDYDNIMFYKDIPMRQQRPLYEDSAEFSLNKNNKIYPLKNSGGSSSGYTVNVNKKNEKEATKLASGIEDLMKSYSKIYNKLDALSILGREYSFGHGVSKREIKKVSQEDSSDEENHVHKSKYNILNGRIYLPFENYEDIYNSKSRRHRKKKKLRHYNEKVNYLEQLSNFGDLPEEDLLKRKLKPAEILSLANILEASNTNFREKRALSIPLSINYPIAKKMKSKIIQIPIVIQEPMPGKPFSNRRRHNPLIFRKEQMNKQGMNNFWQQNFKLNRKKDTIKHSEDKAKIRLKRDITEYEDYSGASKSQSGRSLEKLVNYKTDDEGDPGSMSIINEDGHIAQPAFINSIIYSIKSRRNTLMSQYPQLFTPNLLKVDDEDESYDSQPILPEPLKKQESNVNQFLNMDFPSLSNLAQAVARPPEKRNKKNYKVTVKISPKNREINTTNPGFNELHTTINKSYTENGMRYYTMFNVSEISKVEMEKPPSAQIEKKSDLLERIKNHQAKVDAFIKKHQTVMDSHLKVFEDDANHLNKALQSIVSNISPEAIRGVPSHDLKLFNINPVIKLNYSKIPANNTSIKPLKDLTDKLTFSDLTKEINNTVKKLDALWAAEALKQSNAHSEAFTKPDVFRASDANRGSDSSSTTNTRKASAEMLGQSDHHRIYLTEPPHELNMNRPELLPTTTSPNIVQEIVHKNIYLTEEILKKIDRNTELLNTFLSRLVPMKVNEPKPFKAKKFPMFKPLNNSQVQKIYYKKMSPKNNKVETLDYIPMQLDSPKQQSPDSKMDFNMSPNENHNSNENNFHVPELAPTPMGFGINTIDKHMSNENNGQLRADTNNNEEKYYLDSPFSNSDGQKVQNVAIDTPADERPSMLSDLDGTKPKAVSKVITLPFKVKLNSTENSIP